MKKDIRMSLTAMSLTFVTFLAIACQAFAGTQSGANNATLAFETLKSLAGNWQASTKMGEVSTKFEVVSEGNAVLEHFKMAGGHEMITVYYLDGNRLLLTHYCEAGNQPRMQAASFDPKSKEIDFKFLDATNLPNPNAGHMHQAVIVLHGANDLSEDWTFFKDGSPAFTESVVYHRVN